jgi:hypothetical protein
MGSDSVNNAFNIYVIDETRSFIKHLIWNFLVFFFESFIISITLPNHWSLEYSCYPNQSMPVSWSFGSLFPCLRLSSIGIKFDSVLSLGERKKPLDNELLVLSHLKIRSTDLMTKLVVWVKQKIGSVKF